jgi:hypothetical protein
MFRAHTNEALVGHLNNVHNETADINNQVVANKRAAEQIKSAIEQKLGFNFRKANATSEKAIMYICNRTGKERNIDATGERAPRIKGRLQSNIACLCFFANGRKCKCILINVIIINECNILINV